MFIYSINYMNMNICMLIHVNIFKIYTVCVCIYIYIINIQRTHTYILYKQKLILDAINCCPALIIIQLSKRWPLLLVTLLH